MQDTNLPYIMRKVEIKSQIFEGYSIWIDLSKYDNTNDICKYCKLHLINFLKTFNLKKLLDYAYNMSLYNNMYSSYDELKLRSRETDIIYLYECNSKDMTVIQETNEELE